MDLVLSLIMAVVIIVPFWKVLPRAGWHPALSLLFAVPIANIVLLFLLAFRRWPGDA